MTRSLLAAAATAVVCASAGPLAAPPALAQAPASAPASAPAIDLSGGQALASGLKYWVLQEGRGGPHPKAGDVVRVNYTGRFEDGKVFDASEKHGRAAQFQLSKNLIPGWNEALPLMTVGAKYRFWLPFALAYGEGGNPPAIPPRTNLVFDVELLEILPVPTFTKGDPAKQKATPSGLKYELLKDGQGDAPTAADNWELKWAIFDTNGKLLDSDVLSGQTVKGNVAGAPLPLLKEAPLLLKPGARGRFEVPADLAFGNKPGPGDLPPNSPTVWELELVQVIKPMAVPEFPKLDPATMKTTASGLKYVMDKEGTGASPKFPTGSVRHPLTGQDIPTGDKVRVHYAGWLTDGKPFDSSYRRGEPVELSLGMVIPGWTEGLQLMKEGGVATFLIPANLAYGPRGAGKDIPPNADLVFRVELVKVNP